MKYFKIVIILLISCLRTYSQFEPGLIISSCPDNNSVVTMNYKTHQLSWINIENEIRRDFTTADGKAVYISSWYKLYTLNTTNFEAEENIVVSNNIKVTQWNDKYGLTHKEKIVITTDYYWDSYTVFPDLKYILGIAKHKKEDNYILYYMFLGEGGVGNKNFVL